MNGVWRGGQFILASTIEERERKLKADVRELKELLRSAPVPMSNQEDNKAWHWAYKIWYDTTVSPIEEGSTRKGKVKDGI